MVWPNNLEPRFAELRREIDRAANAEPAWEARYNAVNRGTDFTVIPRQQDRVFLYIFQLSRGEPEVVCDELVRAKERGRTSLPKVINRAGRAFGRTMYVGSSITNISSRLRQHVGDLPRNTSALKLATWFEDNADWSADVFVRGFDGLARASLQLLEDTVANELDPLFGKRGGNGR